MKNKKAKQSGWTNWLEDSYLEDFEKWGMQPKPLDERQKHEFCSTIQSNIAKEKKDNIVVNLAERWLASEGHQYHLTGDGVIHFHRVGADDEVTLALREGESKNTVIFIGSDDDGIIRGFIISNELDMVLINEIDSFEISAIGKLAFDMPEEGLRFFFEFEDYGNVTGRSHFSVPMRAPSLEDIKEYISSDLEALKKKQPPMVHQAL